MSSSTTYRGGQHDTAPIPLFGQAVRPRTLHPVPNDHPASPAPTPQDDSRHTASPVVLWMSLLGVALFVAAVAIGTVVALRDPLAIGGWMVALGVFLTSVAAGAVAVIVHDRRSYEAEMKAGMHAEFFAFVEQASAAANARYQRLLDGQVQVRETLREELCAEVEAAGQRVLDGLRLHLQRVPRQAAGGELVARLDRIEEALEHSSQRAWWLGYAQGTRDQSTDGTVAQLPVRR